MTELRTGLTTGTCAAAAAKAAAMLLCGHPAPADVEVTLPDGAIERVPVHRAGMLDSTAEAEAAVRKDAGDDPDVTDGAFVTVSVSWGTHANTTFAAGEGVGTVTLPGLSVPPGEPAINPVPRRMIRQAVQAVTERPLAITVSIPGGRELAQKTFNPRLGIEGGLSILGTSGRVRPFSAEALECSLICALDVTFACGVTAPVLVPGNIGRRAAELHFDLAERQAVEVGNKWGFMLDEAKGRPCDCLLLVGHPGKLAKLANGDWETHSSRAPSALPLVKQCAEGLVDRAIPETPTVEGLFQALDAPARQTVGCAVAEQVRNAVSERLGGQFPATVVLVNMAGEMLGHAGDTAPWR